MKPINQQTYQAVQAWIETRGYAPSVRELAAILGISSTAAYERLLKLTDEDLAVWAGRFGPDSRRQPRAYRLLPIDAAAIAFQG